MLSLWPDAARSQDPQQTPDSAVRFFHSFAKNPGYAISTTYYSWPSFSNFAFVSSASATGPCQTVFTTAGPYFLETLGGRNVPLSKDTLRHDALAKAYGQPLSPYKIDWTKVTKIVRNDRIAHNSESHSVGKMSQVHVTGTSTLSFGFMDEGPAARFEYAANFMKSECDPTAGTGF
jgi:hypothetical protein